MWKDLSEASRWSRSAQRHGTALRETFTRHRGRVAGIFLELVMMNREAITLDGGFVHAARAFCDQADACLVIDEIQTISVSSLLTLVSAYGILPPTS